MLSAQTKAYALTVAGGLWFGIVVFVVTGHVIMRATAVGIIATDVDMLPSRIREIVFFLLWVLFGLGWTAPIFYALRLLWRRDKRASGPTSGSG